MVVEVEKGDLVLLLPQHEENRLEKFRESQHDSPPPDLVDAKHARELFAGFYVLDAFPRELERVPVSKELEELNCQNWEGKIL